MDRVAAAAVVVVVMVVVVLRRAKPRCCRLSTRARSTSASSSSSSSWNPYDSRSSLVEGNGVLLVCAALPLELMGSMPLGADSDAYTPRGMPVANASLVVVVVVVVVVSVRMLLLLVPVSDSVVVAVTAVVVRRSFFSNRPSWTHSSYDGGAADLELSGFGFCAELLPVAVFSAMAVELSLCSLFDCSMLVLSCPISA